MGLERWEMANGRWESGSRRAPADRYFPFAICHLPFPISHFPFRCRPGRRLSARPYRCGRRRQPFRRRSGRVRRHVLRRRNGRPRVGEPPAVLATDPVVPSRSCDTVPVRAPPPLARLLVRAACRRRDSGSRGPCAAERSSRTASTERRHRHSMNRAPAAAGRSSAPTVAPRSRRGRSVARHGIDPVRWNPARCAAWPVD